VLVIIIGIGQITAWQAGTFESEASEKEKDERLNG